MRSRMAGVLLGVLLAAVLPVLLPLVVTLPAAGVLWCFYSQLVRCLCGVMLGLSLAGLHGQQLLQARLPDECTGLGVQIRGTVTSLPRVTYLQEGRQRQRFEFKLNLLTPESCRGPRRVLLSYYGEDQILPGQDWLFDSRLRKPWGLANQGSFNIQSWFAQTGIDGVGSVRTSSAILLGEAGRGSQWHHRIRHRVSLAIADSELALAPAAVLRAVTVADKSGIDHSLWSLFQQYGINHLLVISGLHVGMVAGLGYLAGSAAGRAWQALGLGKWPWGELMAMLCALAYTAMAGFSVATLRALCMLLCLMAAKMLHRYSGPGNSLYLAALVVLLLNPLAVLGSGFWLSFSAVAALLWLGLWQAPAGVLLKACSAHLFMALLMLPLGGLWFGGSSWVSAPANLIMVPLTGLYVVPLALLGAVASLLGSSLALLFWQMAAVPLDYLLSQVSSSGQDWFLYLAPELPAVLAGLSAVLLLVVPGRARFKSLLPVLLLPLLLPLRSDATAPRLTVLDVGQGTSVVFTAAGRALLYDTGGGNPAGANLAQTVVLPYLRSRGITALDTVIISHGDLDHSAGLGNVLEAMEVKSLWWGGLEGRNSQARPCDTGLAWQWPGNIRFQFLSPAQDSQLSSNNASCVLSIDLGNKQLLLAGDIEKQQERELLRYWRQELSSDVLLVAHHGSKTSSSQSWLNHVQPAVAVVSSAYGSRFGHPHDIVIDRLEGQGVDVRRTFREGAVDVSYPEGSELLVTGWREGIKPWWM